MRVELCCDSEAIWECGRRLGDGCSQRVANDLKGRWQVASDLLPPEKD